MSAPVKEMPTRPGAMTAVTCQRRSHQVDAVSPVQCAAYAPVPMKDDLRRGSALLSNAPSSEPGRWGPLKRAASAPSRAGRLSVNLLHASNSLSGCKYCITHRK